MLLNDPRNLQKYNPLEIYQSYGSTLTDRLVELLPVAGDIA